MNNITVSRVILAYDAGVVKPGFEGWVGLERDCGCAMTALAIFEKPSMFSCLKDVLESTENLGGHEICEAVDVTWCYMLGFTDAFDGAQFGTSDQEGLVDLWDDINRAQYHMGYDHGKAVREAVLEKYFPDGYEAAEEPQLVGS